VQNRFLKLLVTQLKNQDPLNPLDNAAVTTQISQINTVTGIEKLNATLETLLNTYNEGQAMQAAGLIGKSVMVAGSKLALADGEAIGGVNLAGAADSVKLTILDAAGKVVQSQALGAREAGSFAFEWDGKTDAGSIAPAGNYTFKVDAVRGGEKVAAEALQIGTVSALVKGKAAFSLNSAGREEWILTRLNRFFRSEEQDEFPTGFEWSGCVVRSAGCDRQQCGERQHGRFQEWERTFLGSLRRVPGYCWRFAGGYWRGRRGDPATVYPGQRDDHQQPP
jgi:flagellar basal-body rod modification protein FlgD